MDFGSGYCEEEQQMGKGKHPFSYSSSSSPSSSSSQYKTQQLVPLTNNNNNNNNSNTWEQQQIFDQHQQHQMGSWLGNKYDPDEDNDGGGVAAAASKLDLMEVSVSDDVVRHGDCSDAGGRGATNNNVHIEKEHMFDKVVTPSDVGKLNRLVIPKQHAEKYFPLDSSTNDKGLLLNFEDRNGKPWRFRYSYWNSSQSYVMTKGWSRFVKEKKLDAGDVVSFQRGVGELGKDRLYIDWRRRPDAPDSTPFHYHPPPHHHFSFHRSVPWSPLLMRPPPPPLAMARDHLHLPQQQHLNTTNFNRSSSSYYGGGGGGGGFNYSGNVVNPCSMGSVFYLRSPQQQMVEWQQQQQHYHHQQQQQLPPMVYESVPVVQGKAAAKRLRLFGVNMECPISESDVLSSNAISHATIQPSQATQLSSSSQSHLQLRLYNGTPLPAALTPHDFLNKGKASMSLDLDI